MVHVIHKNMFCVGLSGVGSDLVGKNVLHTVSLWFQERQAHFLKLKLNLK